MVELQNLCMFFFLGGLTQTFTATFPKERLRSRKIGESLSKIWSQTVLVHQKAWCGLPNQVEPDIWRAIGFLDAMLFEKP